MVLRLFGSPVPTHTTLVSDWATAMAPIGATGSCVKRGRNVVPLLVVFQMPPAAEAT